MQLSPDGEWFWDGSGWHPAYSPDRRWRWDGSRWLPVGPPQAQRWRYEPTEWTRRVQLIVLAVLVAGGAVGLLILPTVVLPLMQHSLDASLATMPADPNVDPQSFRNTMSAIFATSVVLGGVLGVVILAVLVAGIVKMWRWVYWYLVVSFLIAPLGILQDVAYALTPGMISMPGWLLLYLVPVALIELALGIWMIVLYRRYGTWARRRVAA